MKESEIKFFVTVILIGLSLLTALVLESRMTSGFTTELVLILIGTIIMAGVLFGLWIETEWAYPIATILFAASLANLLWLFFATKAFLIIAFGLIVNVAGLVVCLLNMQGTIAWHELETYDLTQFENKPRRTRRKRRR